jgi:hypothetical protein
VYVLAAAPAFGAVCHVQYLSFPYDDSDARRESEGKTYGYEARLYRKHNGDRRGEHLLYDCAFDAMSMRLGSSSAISRQICASSSIPSTLLASK